MGLLDTLDDPSMRLGLGLLAAASPRIDNASMGQRLMEGVQSLDAWKQQQQKQKLLDMQMQNFQSEIEQRKAAQDKQQRMQDMIAAMFGGTQSATGALASGAAVGDIGPTVTNAARMNGTGANSPGVAGGSRLASMSPDQLALLKANGLDLTDVYKLTRPNAMNVNNTIIDGNDPSNIGKYIPDPTKGFSFNGGKVSVLPGFLDAQDAIVGGQAQAQERAKAGYDLTQVPQSDGSTRTMPRSAAVDALSNPQITNIGQRQPTAQELAIIQADAAKNGIANPIVNLSAPKLGVSQTPADAERAKKLATGEADRTNSNISDQKKFLQMNAGITEAMNLLALGPTASGMGSLVDKGLNFFGQSTTSAELASKLKTISGWLVSNVPRMEGPQSDRDVQNYVQMAGKIGDETVPVPQRIAAAQAVQQLQQKYSDLNNSGSSDKKPAPMFDQLPAANASNKGQRVRDTVTGKILRSNGMKWVEE